MTTPDHALRADTLRAADGLNAALLRDAALPIIGLDRLGAVLRWNEAAARFCGYSMEQMVGQPLDRIVPPSHRPALARKLTAIWNGGPPGRFSGCFVTATGKTATAAVTASPVRRGAIIAISLIIHSRDSHADLPPGAGSQHAHRPILVMEDEALIGLGLVAMLETAGFDTMGPVHDVPSATALLDRHPCGLVILDTHLRGESSAPIARRLKAAGIPFLVTSAQPTSARPAPFDDAPSLPRPWRTNLLVAAVHEALG